MVLGGQPASGRGQRGDVVEEPVLRFRRKVHEQAFGAPGGRLRDVESGWRRAAGQSSRRSMLTVRRSAVGAAPRFDIAVVLKSMTWG